MNKNIIITAFLLCFSTVWSVGKEKADLSAKPEVIAQPAVPSKAGPEAINKTEVSADMPVEELFTLSPFKEIKERGELVVAVHSKDHSPFHMVDKNGELTGIDVEIAKVIAKDLGVKVRFDRTAKDFDAVVELVKERKADIGTAKISFTLERASKVLYSDPYIILHKAVMLNRRTLMKMEGNPNIVDVLSTPGVKLGVLAKTSYVDYAKECFPKGIVTALPEWDAVIKELKDGKLDAVFRDDNEMSKLLKIDPQLNLRFAVISLTEEVDPIALVTNLDNSAFITWVNKVIKNNKNINFNLKDILNKYKDIL
ncbi:MAG: ABC transporter substrate-binding protein [Pseudomonadota bacterium]